MAWIADHKAQHHVLWVPRAKRDSTIGKNIADACIAAQIPLVSFFVHHAVGAHAARHIVPTLVYQLCLLIPDARDIVGRAVDGDPAVLERAMAHQLQTLIVQPCSAALTSNEHGPHSPDHPPIVVVIDGLDKLGECSAGRIVDCLVEATKSVPLPLRVVLCSAQTHALKKIVERNIIMKLPEEDTAPVTLGITRRPECVQNLRIN